MKAHCEYLLELPYNYRKTSYEASNIENITNN